MSIESNFHILGLLPFTITVMLLCILPNLMLMPVWQLENLSTQASLLELTYNAIFLPILLIYIYNKSEIPRNISKLAITLLAVVHGLLLVRLLEYLNWRISIGFLTNPDIGTVVLQKYIFILGAAITLIGIWISVLNKKSIRHAQIA
ncbi:MAG: hypothetical protein ACI86M_002465 [Saprospiraceae bacterium]|jgi:hypothetical protein